LFKKFGIFNKIKDISIIGISSYIGSGINALFYFYFATFLEKSDYGELGYFLALGTFGHAIANIGIYETVVVYGAKKENILPLGYGFSLITGGVVAVVIYFWFQSIPVSLFIFSLLIFTVMQADFISKKKYTLFSISDILRRVLGVILAFALYPLWGIDGAVLGFAIGSIFSFYKLIIFLKDQKLSLSCLKEKFSFMIQTYSRGINMFLFIAADKIMIGEVFGFTILGSYSLAFQYILLLTVLPRALNFYLVPQESQGAKNSKLKTYAIIFAIGIALLSVIISPFLINLVFPEFNEIVLVVQIMGFGVIPMTIFTINESIFLGKEKSELVLICNIVQVSTYFVAIIVLGTKFGLLGLGIAFLIATSIAAILSVALKIKLKTE